MKLKYRTGLDVERRMNHKNITTTPLTLEQRAYLKYVCSTSVGQLFIIDIFLGLFLGLTLPGLAMPLALPLKILIMIFIFGASVVIVLNTVGSLYSIICHRLDMPTDAVSQVVKLKRKYEKISYSSSKPRTVSRTYYVEFEQIGKLIIKYNLYEDNIYKLYQQIVE